MKALEEITKKVLRAVEEVYPPVNDRSTFPKVALDQAFQPCIVGILRCPLEPSEVYDLPSCLTETWWLPCRPRLSTAHTLSIVGMGHALDVLVGAMLDRPVGAVLHSLYAADVW